MNKKVKNAKPTVVCDISFKSRLEATVYKTLVNLGLNPQYEKVFYILSDKKRPIKSYYSYSKSQGFHLDMKPLSNITYTPDFTFKYKGILIIIECKGFVTDSYRIKKNLFRKHLDSLKCPILFFEIRSKQELFKALDIIENETPLIYHIRSLIADMPEKDLSICYKYLELRDFEQLEKCVNSAIQRVEKDRNKDIEKQIYKHIHLYSLYTLQSELLKINSSSLIETDDYEDIEEY